MSNSVTHYKADSPNLAPGLFWWILYINGWNAEVWHRDFHLFVYVVSFLKRYLCQIRSHYLHKSTKLFGCCWGKRPNLTINFCKDALSVSLPSQKSSFRPIISSPVSRFWWIQKIFVHFHQFSWIKRHIYYVKWSLRVSIISDYNTVEPLHCEETLDDRLLPTSLFSLLDKYG